jgi:hypothetical protein
MAALIASSASIEQCNLTGGNLRWDAISVFLIPKHSSIVFPFIHSVARDEDAVNIPKII